MRKEPSWKELLLWLAGTLLIVFLTIAIIVLSLNEREHLHLSYGAMAIITLLGTLLCVALSALITSFIRKIS